MLRTERPFWLVRHSQVTPLVLPTRFPAQARQGAPDWYLARLRLRVVFKRPPRKVWAVVGVSVSGAPSNKVELEVRATPRCPTMASWNSLDIISGFRQGHDCRRSVEIETTNVIADHVVSAGPKKLEVFLGGSDESLAEVMVEPGSGIYVSKDGPGQLEFVGLGAKKGGIRAGSWSRLGLAVRNSGDRPVDQVFLRAIPESGVTVRNDGFGLPRMVSPHTIVHGRVWVRSEAPGRFHLAFQATASSNNPGARYAVIAEDASSSSPILGVAKVVAFVAFAGATLLLGARGFRSRDYG